MGNTTTSNWYDVHAAMMELTARRRREAIPPKLVGTSHTVMRVAMLLESDGPGGAERMLLHLAEELRRRGHWVSPVGPVEGCGWLADQFRARGFEPATYSVRRLLDWRGLRTLVHLLRRHEIDVVHSHDFTMSVYGASASLVRRIPHVLTMHGGRHYAGRLAAADCAALGFRTQPERDCGLKCHKSASDADAARPSRRRERDS